MMDLLETAVLQGRVWFAYTRLNAPEEVERTRAMEALRAAGSASLPCLRLALKAGPVWRKRFAAAIVLHWLGDPQGMETLVNALQWELPTTPLMRHELEAALIRIGSPDAVTALLELWRTLPDWGDTQMTMESICRVWGALRDPRALDGLIARAQRVPNLFEQYVPRFGEMAVLKLKPMLRDRNPAHRLLAARTLRHITGLTSFTALVPLLRDPDPSVRAALPDALAGAGGAAAAIRAVTEALQEGYSTREAVEMILQSAAPPYESLLNLVGRWDPHRRGPSGDTGEAVLAALPALARAPLPNGQIVPTLCALLERRPGVAVGVATTRILGERGQCGEACDTQARSTLIPLLADANGQVRAASAEALVRLGEPLGRRVEQLLAESRPQGSLLEKLHAVLRGGADAGQMASEAMQQVSQWMSRFSKETLERFSPTATGGAGGEAVPDARVPDLLRLLLGNALEALHPARLPEETEEVLSLCVTTIRALGRIGPPGALGARRELIRALHTVKHSMVYAGATSGTFRKSDMREVGGVARAEAAEVLVQLYGPGSFALFLEALYALPMEARATAMEALGRLGDLRALPHLQPIARDPAQPLAPTANEAIARIHRLHPEVMSLLRASSATDARPDVLLRPAAGKGEEHAPDQLLRPSTTQTPPLIEPKTRPATE
ncbi:MAG TPA: HEAT repeat domain-containing protein [Chthonomonadaceae bacterium]|nr:HEAT repeat domain-containing protein [Chthonomonadaceae bacterium]